MFRGLKAAKGVRGTWRKSCWGPTQLHHVGSSAVQGWEQPILSPCAALKCTPLRPSCSNPSAFSPALLGRNVTLLAGEGDRAPPVGSLRLCTQEL